MMKRLLACISISVLSMMSVGPRGVADAATTAGTIELSASSYSVGQSTGALKVTVNRSGGSTGTASVRYGTSYGTALDGIDYGNTYGTLTWANADASPKTFTVPILEKNILTVNRSLSVSISSASNATLGSPAKATLTIIADKASDLAFATSSYTVAQNAGFVKITVNRTNGSNGNTTVAYMTAFGTAYDNVNYGHTTGLLTWANGDTASKTFTVPILDTTPITTNKSFSVKLYNPTVGVLGNPSTSTVTITPTAGVVSTPAVGELKLAAPSTTVPQTVGDVTMTINRTGGSSGAVSVGYATTNGSAVAGTNFTAVKGTMDWADGDEAAKTFKVAINAAAPFTGTKAFAVALSSPGGGATLTTPSTTSVTIAGSSTAGLSPPSGLTMTGQTANSVSLSWPAASAGQNPISHYHIYRNGSSYATSTTTSYVDGSATNATNAVGPGTTYSYAVAAVDSQGNESAKTAGMTFWVYYNGVYNWTIDYSYGCTINYKNSAAAPEEGPYAVSVTALGVNGGFQPVSSGATPTDDFEGSAFNYLLVDLKPTRANQSWYAGADAAGDIGIVPTFSIMPYGPAPVVGKWATYKIPLSAFHIGKASFTGSISGTTLTVTAVGSGVIAPGMDLTGSGIQAGTRIVSPNTNGGKGVYQLTKSQTVGSTTIEGNNYALYKFNIVDASGAGAGNVYYLDNMRFTVN
jgi:hypothetical protein